MSPSVPDVWIRDLTQNTPAHRIVDPRPDPDRRDTAVHRIACPPGEVTGGQVITRTMAHALPALPCARCFSGPRTPPDGVRTAGMTTVTTSPARATGTAS